MLGSAVVVLAPSILPGWALSTVLDGSGDRFRKALLAPALGLLLLFGISGSLVLLDMWSPLLLALTLLAETRHCVRVNLALLVKRPLTLKMPSRIEPRHRRRVLGASLRSLPRYLASRRSLGGRPSGVAAPSRSAVHRRWERSKW